MSNCRKQTGQTTCYNSAGGTVSCIGTGQDGEHQSGVQWPTQRFTDNGDGTVTDNLTGLMWLQNGNLFGAGSRMEWEDALLNLQNMNAGYINNFGYTDWRIPNVFELESLINLGVADPGAWLNSQGFVNVQSTLWYYWSSTGDASTSGSLAWAVRFSDGHTYRLPISGTENGRNHFWAVRGGQTGLPDPSSPANVQKTGQTVSYYLGDDGALQTGVGWPITRFTDNGDGTVTDHLTDLMWLKDASCIANHYPGFDNDLGPGDGAVLWQHALDFIAGINNGNYPNCSGGKNDWRLPNLKELRSLVDHSRYYPALPANHPFTGGAGPITFWTSDSYIFAPNRAWNVDLSTGITSADLKGGGFANYYFSVLPVRAGAIDSDNDGILDSIETSSQCLNVADADTDDDGILDGLEDKNKNGSVDTGETDPCDVDTDNDGIQDGTESGMTANDVTPDTDLAIFISDADPTTTTNPLAADTDRDGLSDGEEDINYNGRLDEGENDPNVGKNFNLSGLWLLLLD